MPAFKQILLPLLLLLTSFLPAGIALAQPWQSAFVRINKDGSLQCIPYAQGNTIPDFNRVGYYYGDRPLPAVPVVKTVSPSADARRVIQAAIDEVSALPLNKHGFRGAVLLKKASIK